MNETNARATRRHHKQRMKAKARFVSGVVWGYLSGDAMRVDIVDRSEQNADHLKACSCEMCRNPRRSKWRRARGRTVQELQAIEELREWR